MASLLRVLLVKDVRADAQRVLRELQRRGFYVEHQAVDTRAAMDDALFHKVWDIVFYDENIPNFTVIEALATLKESGHKLPFFLRSGTYDEEITVTYFQRVGDDFLIQENLALLLPLARGQ
jgi:CheY-like chemotaxis protein